MKRIILTPDPEPKPISKPTIRQRILDELEKRGKMRYMQIMNFIGHGGYPSMIVNDMIKEGIIRKEKYDCGTCDYFELVKKKKTLSKIIGRKKK